MTTRAALVEKPILRSSVILGIVFAFVLPTFIRIAQQSWTQESGSHGPIVLATGLWLLAQCNWKSISTASRFVETAGPWVLLVFIALPVYVFSRAYDFLSLEAGGAYLALLAVVAIRQGFEPILRNFFPIFYLGFLVPLPGWAIDAAPAPLHRAISERSTWPSPLVGYPV